MSHSNSFYFTVIFGILDEFIYSNRIMPAKEKEAVLKIIPKKTVALPWQLEGQLTRINHTGRSEYENAIVEMQSKIVSSNLFLRFCFVKFFSYKCFKNMLRYTCNKWGLIYCTRRRLLIST